MGSGGGQLGRMRRSPVVLGSSGYEVQAADAEGWALSPLLSQRCRLVRRLSELSRWAYELEIAAG